MGMVTKALTAQAALLRQAANSNRFQPYITVTGDRAYAVAVNKYGTATYIVHAVHPVWTVFAPGQYEPGDLAAAVRQPGGANLVRPSAPLEDPLPAPEGIWRQDWVPTQAFAAASSYRAVDDGRPALRSLALFARTPGDRVVLTATDGTGVYEWQTCLYASGGMGPDDPSGLPLPLPEGSGPYTWSFDVPARLPDADWQAGVAVGSRPPLPGDHRLLWQAEELGLILECGLLDVKFPNYTRVLRWQRSVPVAGLAEQAAALERLDRLYRRAHDMIYVWPFQGVAQVRRWEEVLGTWRVPALTTPDFDTHQMGPVPEAETLFNGRFWLRAIRALPDWLRQEPTLHYVPGEVHHVVGLTNCTNDRDWSIGAWQLPIRRYGQVIPEPTESVTA